MRFRAPNNVSDDEDVFSSPNQPPHVDVIHSASTSNLPPLISGEIVGAPAIFGADTTTYTVVRFISAINRCRVLNRILAEDERFLLAFVATRLEGAAAAWYAALEDRQDPCLHTWDAFTAELEAEFTITRTVWQTRHAVLNLRQGEQSVQQFTLAFRALTNALPNFGQEAFLSIYFFALNGRIQRHIRSLPIMPETFSSMVATAMEFDSRADLRSHHAENQDRRQSQSLQPRRDQHARPYQPPTQSAYQPPRPSNAPSHMMEVDAISPTNPNGTSRRDYRRANNLCLYCGASGHYRETCPELQEQSKKVHAKMRLNSRHGWLVPRPSKKMPS